MTPFAWCYPAGIFAVAFLPRLPPFAAIALIAAAALLLAWRSPRWRWLAWGLLGVCHGALWGHAQLAHNLPLALDRTDYRVVGVVSSLPRVDSAKARFVLRVEGIEGAASPPVETLLLSWYGRGQSPQALPRLGERWRLDVRLRTPRGFANPGGFDYRAWLLGEGISATGHVRAGPANQRLDDNAGGPVARLRRDLATQLAARGDSAVTAGYMAALVLGDGSRIPARQWDYLVATGTVHLMVVSGLHVAMVAGGCLILGLGLGRVASALGMHLPAPQLGGVLALAGACGYGLLAGGGLPLQRAVLMTAVATLALVARRRTGTWRAFALALLGVAVIDPLAVLRPGFWLSFGAVAALLLWFVPRPGLGRWRQIVDAQLVVFVALLAALLFFQGQVYWHSPLVNFFMVPWVNLSIVPLCLAGALLQGIPPLGALCWDLAAWQLDGLAAALEWAAARGEPFAWQPANARAPWFVAGLVAAAGLLLLPAALGLRGLAAALLAGLLLGRPAPGPHLEVTVLDVGQGLAVVLRAGERTLVYDTGPAFSDSFDAGSGIVAPYLRSLGVRAIDLLVISHGDNDHAGGARELARAMPVRRTVAAAGAVPELDAEPCVAGGRWRWEGVEFTLLSPPAGGQGSDNNGSCVLLARLGDLAILLPGDIERAVEERLVVTWRDAPGDGIDLLLAPHHGSKTSSSTAFIRWARPRHTVFSAGFRHHFGHPHPAVVARYREAGGALWYSAASGALVFRWDGEGRGPEVVEHRLRPWRPWWLR